MTYDPKAHPSNMVVAGNARFTVLGSALVRLEYDPTGMFEDRASFAFVHRAVGPVAFTVKRMPGALLIETEDLKLTHAVGSGEFSKENLSIEWHVGSEFREWRPGMQDEANLGGTARTLDDVNGACELDQGILSRDGWALIDDSGSLLFGEEGWATPRREGSGTDWYFFGHGRAYRAALRDFTRVAGRIPLPPKYVLGAWWSRYWAYTDAELRDLVAEFRAHDVPLSVLVVDMDWHLDGWTGYTWNRNCFPDPRSFLEWAQTEGLRVTLNLHPHEGVAPHESGYAEFAKQLVIEHGKAIAFDCADPEYMRAYFDVLHRPMESEGVDFWWMDWQQGAKTRIDGLDPLFWLNHLHWRDWEENPERAHERPLVFSRWGGLGNHRYQIGFSGDTHSTWASLAFQPYFTATAGNVGYGWWSHDIGGHQPGQVDPELYLRWIQWGALSPILRTHGTKNPLAERRIWAFGEEFLSHARAMFHLRMRLVPYLYGAAREAYDTGISMCRPLYIDWPGMEEAYTATHEYMLGDDLLCAPVTTPVSSASGLAYSRVWIPFGTWYHWFSKRRYEGPGWFPLLSALDELPLFVREGAIIPTALPMTRDAGDDLLTLEIFPAAQSRRVLYDDDGISRAYEDDGCTRWPIEQTRTEGVLHIKLGPMEGEFIGRKREGFTRLHVHQVRRPDRVTLNGNTLAELRGTEMYSGWLHTPATEFLEVWIEHEDRAYVLDLVVHEITDVPRPTAAIRSPLGSAISIVEPGDEAWWEVALDRLKQVSLLEPLIRAMDPDAPVGTLALDMLERIPDMINVCEGDDADVMRRLWCRLAGISPELVVSGLGEGRFMLAALLHTDRIWNFNDVDFKLGTPGIAAPPEFAGGSSQLLGHEHPWGFAQVHRASEPVNTCVARASVSVTLLRKTVSFDVSKVLFPSINGWWIAGPFENPWSNGLDVPFTPEARFDSADVFVGMEGVPGGWKRALRPMSADASLDGEWFLDLNVHFGKRLEYAVAYALCWIESDIERDVTLAVGSDDGVAVDLNGERLHANHVGRAYASRADRVPMRLRAGRNTLLLKISQGQASWGFCAHIEDAEGSFPDGVRVSLEP